jgi:hypothetical protein
MVDLGIEHENGGAPLNGAETPSLAGLAAGVAAQKQWNVGHERLCNERFTTVNGKVDRLTNSAIAVTIAIAGWAVVQVYGDLKHDKETKAVASAAADQAVAKASQAALKAK